MLTSRTSQDPAPWSHCHEQDEEFRGELLYTSGCPVPEEYRPDSIHYYHPPMRIISERKGLTFAERGRIKRRIAEMGTTSPRVSVALGWGEKGVSNAMAGNWKLSTEQKAALFGYLGMEG